MHVSYSVHKELISRAVPLLQAEIAAAPECANRLREHERSHSHEMLDVIYSIDRGQVSIAG